jgi:hypothetical protein
MRVPHPSRIGDGSIHTEWCPMHASVLIGLYVLIAAVAQVAGYFLGVFIERSAPAIGLPAYLAVSMGMLLSMSRPEVSDEAEKRGQIVQVYLSA